MQRQAMRRAMQCACLFLILPLLALSSAVNAEDEKRDGSFGFDGKKIFKFNRGVGPVTSADVDGDGRHDIIVVDNYRAELVLLVQDNDATGKTFDKGPNSVNDADGFERRTLPLKSKVAAIEAVNLDGDSHVDLVLVSSGKIQVWWGDAENSFRDNTSVRLRGAIASPKSVALDRRPSGKVDLYLLGRKGVFRFQDFSRERAPRQDLLPSSASNAEAIFVTDLDGDGLKDLLTVVDDREHPYRTRFRLADELGFGPEVLLAGDRPGAVSIVSGPERSRIVSLALGKARFDILELKSDTSSDALDLPGPEVYPLDAGGLSKPKLLVDDVDGDGDVDVVVAHNGDNTLLMFLNNNGELTPTQPSPTLRSVASLGLSRHSKPPQLIIASSEEKVVGSCQVADLGLTFPKALAGLPHPMLANAGSFTVAQSQQIAVVTRDEASSDVQLRLFQLAVVDGEKEWRDLGITQKLTLKGDPNDSLVTDLNGDGVHELLLFSSYGAPTLMRVQSGSSDEPSWESVAAPGVFEKCSRGAVSIAGNGDLLLSTSNHCRRVMMNQEGQLAVRYQVNGNSGNSSIGCAVEVRLGDSETPYLALLDKSDNSLNLYDTVGARPQFRRSFDGPFGTVQQATAADLDGDGRDEILLLNPTALAVVRTDGSRRKLESLFTYSHPDEKSRYAMATSGDLNGDQQTDLALSNGSLRKLQFFRAAAETPGTEGHWVHALRFPVYEAKSFSGRSSGALEPRWLHIADLTDDGNDDLLILVHDRLILYPQDANR